MVLDPSPSPFVVLPAVLAGLRTGIAGWHRRLDQAVLMLCWGYVSRLIGRFERLSARFVAGKAMVRVARFGVSRQPVARGVVMPRIWPRRFGWLVRQIGWEAAGFGSQVAHQLAQPEMVALLIASPQARRLLRPVCRMLAVDMRLLRPAGVVEVARARIVRAPVVRALPVPVGKVALSPIPLPRGVLARARRERCREGLVRVSGIAEC